MGPQLNLALQLVIYYQVTNSLRTLIPIPYSAIKNAV